MTYLSFAKLACPIVIADNLSSITRIEGLSSTLYVSGLLNKIWKFQCHFLRSRYQESSRYLQGIEANVAALVNDTVGVLCATRYTFGPDANIAVVMGTGELLCVS